MHSIYDIHNNKDTSSSEILASAEFADVGHKGWTIQTYNAAGIDYVLLTAVGDSDEFPLHKDTNEWFGYIVEGEGSLLLGTETNTTETIKYKAGDIVIFRPDTYHGWKSNSTITKLMFVKPSAVV